MVSTDSFTVTYARLVNQQDAYKMHDLMLVIAPIEQRTLDCKLRRSAAYSRLYHWLYRFGHPQTHDLDI